MSGPSPAGTAGSPSTVPPRHQIPSGPQPPPDDGRRTCSCVLGLGRGRPLRSTSGDWPQRNPSGPQLASSPVGSLYVVGLLLAYAYPLSCCGSFGSTTGSTVVNAGWFAHVVPELNPLVQCTSALDGA